MIDRIAKLMPSETAEYSAASEEAAAGKMIATVSYIFCPIAILPFLKRDNGFALYHAKQALTLLVAALAAGVVLFAIGFVLSIVKLGIITTIVSLAFTAAMLGLIVVGAVTAWKGECNPLPVIGGLAGKLFGCAQL